MSIYSLGEGMNRVDVFQNSKMNSLPIGTVLKMNGYGYHESVIVANYGISERFQDYGARYRAISKHNYMEMIVDAFQLKHISQKKDDRIKTYYTDIVVSADEVLDLIEKGKQTKQEADLEVIAK